MIRALYNCISNTERWVIQYYSCFSPKTKCPVYLCYIWTHHDPKNLNSCFTEQTWTHHHAARNLKLSETLKLYLLFKITSLYVADYNTDFTIGLLFLIDGTSDKVCVRLPLTLWVDDEDGPSVVRHSEVLTAFGLYLMHNASVLGLEVVFPTFLVQSRLDKTYISS